jgi:hypothetical protein
VTGSGADGVATFAAVEELDALVQYLLKAQK